MIFDKKLYRYYQTTDIFEIQKKEWSPFATDSLNTPIDIFNYGAVTYECKSYPENTILRGKIFIESLSDDKTHTILQLKKGDVKNITQFDRDFKKVESVNGDIEILTVGITSIYFPKYTGDIAFTCQGKTIISIDFHKKEIFNQ